MPSGQFAVLLVILNEDFWQLYAIYLGICLLFKSQGFPNYIDGSTASEYMLHAGLNSLGMRHEVLHCLQRFLEVIFAHSPEYDNVVIINFQS